MARQKSKEKELQWRDGLRRQASSGLSICQFCARERISQPSFCAWRRRLRESPGCGEPSRTISRRVEPVGGTGEFVSLKLLAPTSVLLKSIFIPEVRSQLEAVASCDHVVSIAVTPTDLNWMASDLTHAIVKKGCRDSLAIDLSERLEYAYESGDGRLESWYW